MASSGAVLSLPRAQPVSISTVLFDFDNVFVDATFWQRWLFQLLSRLGLHTHYREFYQIWEREYLPDVHLGRRHFWDALRDFLISAALTPPLVDEVVAASHARYRELETTSLPLPGVMNAISDLSQRGIRVAILCNTHRTGNELRGWLERHDLDQQIDSVFTSIDTRLAKPDVAVYHAAEHAMSSSAEETAYVGQHSDFLRGAINAGILSVAVNFEPGTSADLHLDRISFLVPKLESYLAILNDA